MALETGIWFLVNIGYGGPLDEAAVSGMTCPTLHIWPPLGLTSETRQDRLIAQVLQTAPAWTALMC
ncbi:hypothetical protein ABIE28_002755 [Devosia sp. 2618]